VIEFALMLLKAAKRTVKKALSPVLYRFPLPELQPERLYVYLDSLLATKDVPGSVVEVGCFQCGTAATAYKFLRNIGCRREYVCFDTFGGFPRSQFKTDVAMGTTAQLASGFSANSLPLVRGMLNRWGFPEIELVKADVVKMAESDLPESIAVALIDVDIAEPTEAAIRKILPRLSPGGVILVDDCDDGAYKGARIAVEKVVPSAQYRFGMGIIKLDR